MNASELDLRPYQPSGSDATAAEYKLVAAIVHDGSSVNDGHYRTFGRRHGHWYQFNDKEVEQMADETLEERHALSCAMESAYMLFYERIERAVLL